MRPSIRRLLVNLLLCWATAATAQQTPYIGFYRQNWQMVNPASMDPWSYKRARGWKKATMLTASHRSQWVGTGIEGAPVLYVVSLEHTFDMGDNGQPFKVGGVGFRDATDAIGTTGGNLTGSYYWPAGNGFVHIGAGAGVVQYGVDRSKLRPADTDDEVLNNAVGNSWLPDFSVGAVYRDDLRYIGLSMPQTLGELFGGSRRTHVYLVAGRFFETRAEGITTELSTWARYTPGLMYRSIGALPVSADVAMRAFFDQNSYLGKDKMHTLSWWMGGGLGTGLTAQVEFGAEVERGFENYERRTRMRVGLVYSRPFAQRTAVLGGAGSFEVVLAMAFN